jgi:hypothetical protein
MRNQAVSDWQALHHRQECQDCQFNSNGLCGDRGWVFQLTSVKLDGVVVCYRAKILARSSLKDTEVGGGYTVAQDTLAKGEQLI